ncbi:MAG: hypothetical protein GH155_01045 [Spirochaeta sp.]|nr:hypothetical protein [Spirochaeta sp.]
MKKTSGVLIPLILVSLLTGCAELFEFNLFRALDPIKMPDAAMLSEMESEEGVSGVLDYLEAELGSPSFIEKLDEEPGSYDAIEDYLIDHKGNSEDGQKATLLLADLYLKTSGGEEFVNNSITAAINGDFDGLTGQNAADFLEGFLSGLIPDSALSSFSAFTDFLDALSAANQEYHDFAASLDLVAPVDEPDNVPDNVNLGDVVQKAIITQVVVEARSVVSDADLYTIAQGGNVTAGDFNSNPLEDLDLKLIMNAAGIDESNFQ